MLELLLFGAMCLVLGVALGMLIQHSQQDTVEPNSFEKVWEFHQTFGHPVRRVPVALSDERSQLRVALIAEELAEYQEAVMAGDIVAQADALGDLEYVVNGAAVETGINLPAVVTEIHRSNMTKLGPDGKPIYREDGKILKGEGYEPPQLRPVLGL